MTDSESRISTNNNEQVGFGPFSQTLPDRTPHLVVCLLLHNSAPSAIYITSVFRAFHKIPTILPVSPAVGVGGGKLDKESFNAIIANELEKMGLMDRGEIKTYWLAVHVAPEGS